jgi:hypothetical protein
MRVLLSACAVLVVLSLALAYETGGVQSALWCAVFYAVCAVIVAFVRCVGPWG